MSNFEQLGLSPMLLGALAEAGFAKPTPIQEKAIPLALDGHDILGLAQTGTGKTLGFGLPLLDALFANPGKPAPKSPKALILAPTRELANQITDNLRPLAKGTRVHVTTVVGGQSINKQAQTLARGIDILVATPGRLIDLIDRGDCILADVRFLVLDEADQMLDMGFIHALRRIATHLKGPRQTMLFSATMPKALEEIAGNYLNNPRRVQVAPPGKTADKIEQSVKFIEKGAKPRRLREILSEDLDSLTLVFGRTKHGMEKLCKQLIADGYNAAAIHGNKSQGQRDRAIKAFREGEVKILVATDVAARGIDIPGVARVINYELPNVPEAYVHRIGRTARAGRDGIAISFCSPDELGQLRDIEKLIGRTFGAAGMTPPSQTGKAGKSGKPGAGEGKKSSGRNNRRPKRRTGGHSENPTAQNANGKPNGNRSRAGSNRSSGKPRTKSAHTAA